MPRFRIEQHFALRRRKAFLTLDAGLGPSEHPSSNEAIDPPEQSAQLYLDLMMRSLVGWTNGDKDTRTGTFDPQARKEGRDRPEKSLSMIGLKRLNNLRNCAQTVLRDGIPGDLIETGVWRGGAAIFMRAVLKAHGVTDRKVWVADSFKGLPEPDPRYPADAGDIHHTIDELAVSLEQVQTNFRRHGLLDENVEFLEGWFTDTLPNAPIESLAVARLDGDMYGSTMDALISLYPKLSPGGFLIVDDYGAVPGCRKAVEDFRRKHDVSEEIIEVDWTGIYWRRSS